MSNSLFNPFQIQKFFGQNIITPNLEPGKRFEIASNIIFVGANFSIFVFTFFTNENKVGDARYSFISQMRYCMQFYFGMGLMAQISFSFTFFRKMYVNSYHALINYTKQLRKINVHTEFKILPVIIKFTFVFVTVLPMFVLDVYTFWDKYTFPFFICHYVPSLAISVYIISISTLMTICTSKFKSINGFLKKCAGPYQSSIKKFYINKRNLKPGKLLEAFPGENVSIYQMLFLMHDELVETARSINTISGFDIVLFTLIVATDSLSFIYDICMDVSTYFTENALPTRNIYAIEYWSVMNALELLILIIASTELMENANETKSHLHNLRNLYPQLNEHLEMFSMQLLHSTLKITAGRFFTINRGIFYMSASAVITYIILFMQLNTDRFSS